MVGLFGYSAGRPSPGSWLANWLDRRRQDPESFLCGVRLLTGAAPGVTRRWKYRRSAVDRLRQGDVVTLHHGTKYSLRLRMDADPFVESGGPRPRQGLTVLAGTVAAGGESARVLVAVEPGELDRFGIDSG